MFDHENLLPQLKKLFSRMLRSVIIYLSSGGPIKVLEQPAGYYCKGPENRVWTVDNITDKVSMMKKQTRDLSEPGHNYTLSYCMLLRRQFLFWS